MYHSKTLTFDQVEQLLKDEGYMIARPAGDNRIFVSGFRKRYYNAKKAAAKSIVECLILRGYNASSKLANDGFYDIIVTKIP